MAALVLARTHIFGSGDAVVLVAFITMLGTLAQAWLNGKRTKRAAVAAEEAAHNTKSNGHLDEDGNPTEPTPYDKLMASHEYMIGQIHAAATEARAANEAAALGRAATRELAKKVDAGFAAAKLEREGIGEKLATNIDNGREFAILVGLGSVDVLDRLDALDGKETAAALHRRLVDAGLVPPDAPEV